jgi:predicted DNA-binding protein YlxM (UPF0122 family)
VASQIVPAAKRFRISLLLDAYGELLTDKQQTFLRRYFEQDLSFGEIARDYGVSRQAIFDAVKHGEESLEKFERTLKLVESGWGRWREIGLTPAAVAARLAGLRERLGDRAAATRELNDLIESLQAQESDEGDDA